MKLITRDTDYAIRALCFIAKNNEKVVSVPELVRATKIPRPFLRKILQALHNYGILRSYKGKGGGFCLARSADKIILTDIMRVFQGKLRLSECIFKGLRCPQIRACPLNKKISRIERFVIKELKNISIGCLTREAHK